MWQGFMAQHPDWFVIFNESNQMPHRAFGAPIQISDLFSFLAVHLLFAEERIVQLFLILFQRN